MNKYYLTSEKYEELKARLEELKTKGREEMANKLDQSRKEGTISAEDSNYSEILENQRLMEEEIEQISEQLKNAEIIEKTKKGGVVEIGSEVIVEFMGKVDKFMIVGEIEADPSKGKISNSSPVGRELLGKKEGQEFEVKTPVVTMKYKILEII
jgi:transcription elongation factor GreA